MNASTDWVSAIAILAAGLVLGALFFYFNKRRNAQTLGGEVDLERKDLTAKRDALIQQLRDPSLGVDERTRLELETAEVLRKLDEYQPTPRGAEELRGTPRNSAVNPTVKGFLWGAASMAALFALGYFVMREAKPRQEGDEITGGFNAQQQAQNADPAVQTLEAAVQAQPGNIELRNNLAQAYLERDNLMAVFEQTRVVLAQAPENSRALTLQGLVRMAMGETEQATSMLQRATKNDPKNLDGWVALAWVYAQSDRMQDAERMIQSAAQQVPEERTRLEQVFVQMKAQLAQQDVQQAGNALPEGHPPVEAPPAAPAANAPASGVRVTLDLDANAKPRTGIVFVIARNPAGGPPVAVKRVVATSFPMNVELTSADSMMGQQLPANFRLEARLDTDGDPMTKPPTDPSALQNGVAPGATVRLALK